MNDNKLPPLFPNNANNVIINDVNYSNKFITSQQQGANCNNNNNNNSSPDHYREILNQHHANQNHVAQLNSPQSPFQVSEYSSSQGGYGGGGYGGGLKNEMIQHQNNVGFVEVGSYGRKDWLA